MSGVVCLCPTALLALAILFLPGCRDELPSEQPSRSERFGILDEFVVFDVPRSLGGVCFVDRFETTASDWAEWLRTTGRPDLNFRRWNRGVDPDAPVRGVALDEARRYARWRFGRLPSLQVWQVLAGGGAGYRFPWGEVEATGFASTADLGRVQPLPVGTFASGAVRGVFDLIGNAGEWTETVEGVGRDFEQQLLDPERRQRLVRALSRGHWPLPLGSLVFVDSDDVRRAVVPGIDRRLRDSGVAALPSWSWPGERSDTVSVRVVSDPVTLLRSFDAFDEPLTRPDRQALARFCRRPLVRQALERVFRQRPDLLSSGRELSAFVSGLLGGSDSG